MSRWDASRRSAGVQARGGRQGTNEATSRLFAVRELLHSALMRQQHLLSILARASRPFVALLVALLVSGAPHAAAAVLHGSEPPCASDCGDEDEQGACPPLCTQGACAKVFPTVVPPEAPLELEQSIEAKPTTPAPPHESLGADGVSTSVFHPPRA